MKHFCVASTSVNLGDVQSPDAVFEYLDMTVKKCVNESAELLLLPEYLTTLFELMPNYNEWIDQKFLPKIKDLAQKNKIWIVAGTHLYKVESANECLNRCFIVSPDGVFRRQDKICLIPSERVQTPLTVGGNELQIIELRDGIKMGILICYDSEFPELARRLSLSDKIDLLVVPSWTSTLAGFWRVRYCSIARAIENQLFVMQAPLVGSGRNYLGDVEQAFGRAAIYAPCDIGFPNDGIIAEGKDNLTDIVFANLNFERLDSVRRHGHVSTLNDAKILKNRNIKVNC